MATRSESAMARGVHELLQEFISPKTQELELAYLAGNNGSFKLEDAKYDCLTTKLDQLGPGWTKTEKATDTFNLLLQARGSSRSASASTIRVTYDMTQMKPNQLAQIFRESIDTLVVSTIKPQSCVEKKRLDHRDLPEANLRVNLRAETAADMGKAVARMKTTNAVTIRRIKRISYVNETIKTRIDVSKVKQITSNVQIRIKDVFTQLIESDPGLEVEIEYFGAARSADVAERLSALFAENVQACLNPHADVRAAYARLIATAEPKPTAFVGPKPVTLDLRTAREVSAGTFGRYTVTDKADGERRLLFAPKETGRVYLINDRMEVELFEGVESSTNVRDSLLDGEVLDLGGPGEPGVRRVFLVFDAYFFCGKDVRGRQLMSFPAAAEEAPAGATKRPRLAVESRLSAAGEVLKGLNGRRGEPPRVHLKVFRGFSDPSSFRSACGELLAHDMARELGYETDGLILTPNDVPPPSGGGTWSDTFKWKPPDMNSVDFMVMFEPLVNADKTRADRASITAALYVRAKKFDAFGPITSLRYLSNRKVNRTDMDANKVVDHKYAETQLSCVTRARDSCYVMGKGATKDGYEVRSGQVLECRYDRRSRSWEPMRPRQDKPVANFLATVENVVDSIEHPVTREMLIGQQPIPEPEGEYYTHSDRQIMAGLRKHHNAIKSRLFMAFSGRGVHSIIDFGVGRGGDLGKFQDLAQANRLSHMKVFGIDTSPVNLSSPSDKIASAYYRLVRNPEWYANLRCVFLPMDASSDLTDPSVIDEIRSPDDRAVARLVFGHPLMTNESQIEDGVVAKYAGFAINGGGFKLASCMFAVHYMFASRAKLDQFAANVDRFVSQDSGYFVGACLDGQKVRMLLNDKAGHVEHRDPHGRVLWSIRRAYEGGEGEGGEVGQAIDVYVATIGQTLREYLVDFDVLVRAMEQTGKMHRCATGGFEEMEQHASAAADLSDAEREYSRLHRWFVFSRARPEDNEADCKALASAVVSGKREGRAKVDR